MDVLRFASPLRNSLLKGWQKILWTEDRKSMEGLDDPDPTQLPSLDTDSDEEEGNGNVKKEQQDEHQDHQGDLEDALEKQMEHDYPKDQRSAYHMHDRITCFLTYIIHSSSAAGYQTNISRIQTIRGPRKTISSNLWPRGPGGWISSQQLCSTPFSGL